ncbi:MAG: hypothetical protein M3P12_15375 [Gemmatimonadota bacterium]|nr:hypothetical protein [Gemmatimonadota bacterium]
MLLTGFHFAPKKPQKTLPILRRAATASVSAAALAYYENRYSSLTKATEPVESNKLVSWSFMDRMPDGWRVIHASDVRAGGYRGTALRTGAKNFEKQLSSPAVSLAAGAYEIVVEGRVVEGGLGLGAERGSTCLGNSFFSAGEWRRRRDAPLMVRPLTLGRHQQVRIILSNWAFPDAVSLWNIRRVFIRSLSVGEKRAKSYAALASPLVRMSKFPVANARFSWNLRSSSKGWFLANDVQATRTRAGLGVRTARSSFGYELTAKVTLGRGPYLLRLHGDIIDGGISFGAVDERTNKWLGQGFYWYGQSRSPGAMAVPFSVKRPSTVQLVIANWSVLEPAVSRWLLSKIELVQLY